MTKKSAKEPETKLSPADNALETVIVPRQRDIGGFAVGRGLPSAERLALLDGEPLDGPRYLWWNFVSSSRERIEQAKADWKSGRFAAVPGDPEFIPLPEG
jgi:hypothetical protein